MGITIKNNISFKTDITLEEEDEIKKLLKIVELDDFVKNLDNKINTLISAENGIKLSSGQAQRICNASFFAPCGVISPCNFFPPLI